jgi:hypothetical protein
MARKYLAIVVGLVALTISLAVPGTAYADTAPAPDQTVKTRSGMSVVDVDESVARQAGLEVVRDDHGNAIAVRDPDGGFSVNGFDDVWGNCGYSWISFAGVGGRQVELRTGWSTFETAISFGWRVDIIDSAGVSARTWGHPMVGNGWDGYYLATLTPPSAWAGVNPGASWALLWWGGICVSGGPNTTTPVF